MGDFNVFHSLNEKRGRGRWWSSWQNDLDNYLIQSSLEDLRFTDSIFTWTNQQCTNLILKKLDLVLINVKWKCDFAAPKVSLLPFDILNHFSILVNLVEKPKSRFLSSILIFGLIILNLYRLLPRPGKRKSSVL
jgi:hypothetical protein